MRHGRRAKLRGSSSGERRRRQQDGGTRLQRGAAPLCKIRQVEEKARDAEQAFDGSEHQQLLEAEAIGKSRSAGEDAHSGLSANHDKVSARAYEIWEHDGRPEGRHEDHWYQAERNVTGE